MLPPCMTVFPRRWNLPDGVQCVCPDLPSGADTACEDLARAIAFLHENADELQIDMTDYSLWGGLQARVWRHGWVPMERKPSESRHIRARSSNYAVYRTFRSDRSRAPTYACVGTNDGIASYRSMEYYISRIQENGTDAEIQVFDGLRHGFGLGEGTAAEGWLDNAVSFWERNMKE